MSHRWDCPTESEARHRGERDFEWGRSRSSNPYEDRYGRGDGCEEAADAWRSGYRRAEIREEEQREEEAARHRAEVRRAYELDEEAYYYQRQSDSAEHELCDEMTYIRERCASTNHARYEGSDKYGARCYCGAVRWLDDARSASTNGDQHE